MDENIKIPWGSWEMIPPDYKTIVWHPNYDLKMPIDEQYRQNVENGYCPSYCWFEENCNIEAIHCHPGCSELVRRM